MTDVHAYASMHFPTLYKGPGSQILRRLDLDVLYETPIGLRLASLSEPARRIVEAGRLGGPRFALRYHIPSIEDAAEVLGGGRYSRAAARWRATYGSHCDAHLQTRTILMPPLRLEDDPHEALNRFAATPSLCVSSTPSDPWVVIDGAVIRPNDWLVAWESMLRRIARRIDASPATA